MIKINIAQIPKELKAINQWVNWKNVKGIKIPVQGDNIKVAASTTNKKTWTTFDAVKKNISNKTISGLGFCLTDNDDIVVIDIDHCIVNKQLNPMAKLWVTLLNSYTEISPSGTGIHIFAKGDIKSLIGNGKKTLVKHSKSGLGFEVYCTSRYFTMTGVPLPGKKTCGKLNNSCQNILELFYHTYFKKGKSSIWKPIDGVTKSGDRNNTMQKSIGAISNNIVQLVDIKNKPSPNVILTYIIDHYNTEYFKPALNNKEMTAQLKSAEKYLDKKIDEYDDVLTTNENDEDYDDDDAEEKSQDNKKVLRKIVDRYVFVKVQNKFYDKNAKGALLVKESINFAHGEKRFLMKVKGELKKVELSSFIKHSDNKQVVDNITWTPKKDEVINNEGELLYNTYSGINLNYLPATCTDKQIGIYLKLAKYIIPNPELLDAMLDFIAFTIQYPHIKINYGIIFCSEEEGLGKDLLLRPIVNLLGSMAKEIKADTFLKPYNQYLDKTKLLIIQEIYTSDFKDKKAMESNLKPLLAAPPDKLEIDTKHEKLYFIDNVVSVIMTTNHDDAISITDADKSRRYLAIQSNAKPLSEEYYEDFAYWLYEEKGWELVARWLLDRDVENFNYIRSPFKTAYLKKLAFNGQNALYHRLNELLDEGLYPFDLEFIKTHDIRDALDETRLSNKAIGIALRKLKYHNFGVSTDEIKKKVFKDENGKVVSFNGWCNKDSPSFNKHIKLTGNKLQEIYAKRIKAIVKKDNALKVVKSRKGKFT